MSQLASVPALARPVESLDEVGPARARELRILGVNTLGDLLNYFPRNYQHESSEGAIADVSSDGLQTARGTVVAVNYVPGPRSRFQATIEDESGKLGLVFFNGAYLRTRMKPGMEIRVRGKVTLFHGIPQMANPKWQEVDADTPALEEEKFRAIYPASSKLASDVIEKIMAANIETALRGVEEWFEDPLLKSRKLMSRGEAYRLIHQPRNLREALAARKRLVYDELMTMQLGLGLSRRMRDSRISAAVLRLDKLLDERIRKRFSFTFTNAQQRSIWEVMKDLQSGQPMNRLLQGDVGSGKTAVAVYAMLVAVANKMQAALLAPTEVLAEQHYLLLSNLLRDSAVKVELVTSRTKRRGTKARRHEGTKGEEEISAHIVVGTQALLQEDVEFGNLGLVVIDEQHKLGVRQRATLKSKGLSPHYLVMTATPIPRTLALSYFADFDLSVIDELPPGRQAIETRWRVPGNFAKTYEFVRAQVESGRQAYVVAPQIDDSGDDAKSVTKEFDRLKKGPLAGLRLAMLHGQMSADEKQSIMQEFRGGKIDVLVATTVIEVGIDVPNATVMVIEDAERFGLSQLHQLRGRVGRGSEKSYCILVSDGTSETTRARLEAMTMTNDGFEIAETDLKIRGPGEFFGTRQHGLPEFKLADLGSELELLQTAKEDALKILDDDPKLSKHVPLRNQLMKQFGEGIGLAQVG